MNLYIDTLFVEKKGTEMEQYNAKIQMKKMILEEGTYDDTIYDCVVIRYDAKEEQICLALVDAEIDQISLDGLYTCVIEQDGSGLECEGRITNRYCNCEGNLLCFRIEKGFYKININ